VLAWHRAAKTTSTLAVINISRPLFTTVHDSCEDSLMHSVSSWLSKRRPTYAWCYKLIPWSKIVDDTRLVIIPKDRYWWKIAIFAPVRGSRWWTSGRKLLTTLDYSLSPKMVENCDFWPTQLTQLVELSPDRALWSNPRLISTQLIQSSQVLWFWTFGCVCPVEMSWVSTRSNDHSARSNSTQLNQ